MGQIALSIPQDGVTFQTEGPKVENDLTLIQNVINGNLDETNLFSPNNSVRRLLLHAHGYAQGGLGATGLAAGTYPIATGSLASTNPDAVVWAGDSGLSSQPQDFQVANKTAYGRLRVSLLTNTVTTGITFTFGLYPIASVGGVSTGLTLTLGTVVAGSTITFASPATSSALAGESSQFALPVANTRYVMAVNLSGAMPSNTAISATAQLYGYNA